MKKQQGFFFGFLFIVILFTITSCSTLYQTYAVDRSFGNSTRLIIAETLSPYDGTYSVEVAFLHGENPEEDQLALIIYRGINERFFTSFYNVRIPREDLLLSGTLLIHNTSENDFLLESPDPVSAGWLNSNHTAMYEEFAVYIDKEELTEIFSVSGEIVFFPASVGFERDRSDEMMGNFDALPYIPESEFAKAKEQVKQFYERYTGETLTW